MRSARVRAAVPQAFPRHQPAHPVGAEMPGVELDRRRGARAAARETRKRNHWPSAL